jgi:hypothetical protein
MVGRAVAAVATPALGASVPGVAVISGVIRCACTPACGTAAPEGAGVPDGAAWSTRSCASAVPASRHCPSL